MTETETETETACPGSGEYVHPISGTNMNGWVTNTLQGACRMCGSRFMGWVGNYGVRIPAHQTPEENDR